MINLNIRGISSDCTEYGTVTTDCVTVGKFITEVCGKYPDSELTFRTEEGREITFKGERNVEVKDFALLDSITWAGGYGEYTFNIKTKPKIVRREGWVNVYRTSSDNYKTTPDNRRPAPQVFNSKEAADQAVRLLSDQMERRMFVATAHIEWEEVQNER